METASSQRQVIVDRLAPAPGQKSNLRKQLDDLLFGSVSTSLCLESTLIHTALLTMILLIPLKDCWNCRKVCGIPFRYSQSSFADPIIFQPKV